jgi:hypothetical protein
MPVQARVEVVERPVSRHVDLRALRLLGGAPVDPEPRGQAASFRGTLRGDGGACQRRPEQVVAAPVAARNTVDTRLRTRNRPVAEAGQRVVLGEEADCRSLLALRPLRHERGRDTAGPAACNGEARRVQLAKVRPRRRLLVEAHLRELPDLVGEALDDVPDGFRRMAGTLLIHR